MDPAPQYDPPALAFCWRRWFQYNLTPAAHHRHIYSYIACVSIGCMMKTTIQEILRRDLVFGWKGWKQ